MKYSLVIFGKFSYFKIAESLVQQDRLVCLYTSYPKFMIVEKDIKDRVWSIGFLHIWLRLGHRIFRKGGFHDQLLKKIFSSFVYLRLKWFDDKADVYVFFGQNGYHIKLLRLLKGRGRKIVFTDGSAHPLDRNKIMSKLRKDFCDLDSTQVIPEYIVRYYDLELSYADLIVAPSSFVRKSIINNSDLDPNSIKVIPHGVNIHKSPIANDNKIKHRILILGVVSAQKGAWYIIEAAKELDTIQFEFVGEIEINLSKLDIPANVKFCGKIPYTEVLNIMSKYDALLIASIQDGFAAVVPQAIVSGLSIISSQNVGAVDICSDDADIIFEPFSHEAIIAAVNMFYSDFARYRNAALERQSRPLDFSWSSYTSKIEDILKSHD